MYRKILALLLVCVMLIGVVGCKKKNQNLDLNTSEATTATNESGEKIPSDKKEENTKPADSETTEVTEPEETVPTVTLGEGSISIDIGVVPSPDDDESLDDPFESTTEPSKPGTDATEPSKPGTDATEPSKPGTDATEPSKPGTNVTEPSVPEGENPDIGDFVPSLPDYEEPDPTVPSGDGPGEEDTVPTIPEGEDPEFTEPGNNETEPSDPGFTEPEPSEPEESGPTADDYAWYIGLSGDEQSAFVDANFANLGEFMNWYKAAQAAYEAIYGGDIIGGGAIDGGNIG